MPVDQVAERLWGADHARYNIVAIKDGTINVAHRLPGKTRKMLEQIAVVAKVSTEAFRHGEDKLPVEHGNSHVLCDIDGGDQHALLMAAWADAALFAGKRDEQVVSAIRAAHPGEPFAQVAATQKSINRFTNHGPKETVALLVTVRIHPFELVEVLFEQLKQRRLTWCAPPIEPGSFISTRHRHRHTPTIGE